MILYVYLRCTLYSFILLRARPNDHDFQDRIDMLGAKQIMPLFCAIFLQENMCNCVIRFKLAKVCPNGCNCQYVRIGACNILTPNRQQAVTWTNVDRDVWHHKANQTSISESETIAYRWHGGSYMHVYSGSTHPTIYMYEDAHAHGSRLVSYICC